MVIYVFRRELSGFKDSSNSSVLSYIFGVKELMILFVMLFVFDLCSRLFV